MSELRRYATLLAAATAGSTPLVLPMRKAGSADLAGSGDWTPAAGDVKVSIDEGAQANVTNLPTFVNGRWRLILTAAELTGKSILVTVIDAATKAVDDEEVEVQTFGHASAFYPDLYSAPLIGSPAGGSLSIDVAAVKGDTAATLAAVDTEVGAIKAKTDLIAGPPAQAGDAMTLTPAGYNAAADALIARARPATATAGTVGEALEAAWSQGYGRWAIVGNTLTLYAPNGTTVLKQFDLTPHGGAFNARTPI